MGANSALPEKRKKRLGRGGLTESEIPILASTRPMLLSLLSVPYLGWSTHVLPPAHVLPRGAAAGLARTPPAATHYCRSSDLQLRADSVQGPMRPGSLVALVTPMRADGSVDVERLRSLIQWHLVCETDGIVALGTTGEASTMSMDERATVLGVCRDELAGTGVPLMVGTGTIDPKRVIAMNEQAYEYGADSCLVVTPYYVKPPQQAMVTFFETIADATPLPMLLYNVPGRTASDLQPETVAQLAKHPKIFGIKEATGDLTRVEQLQRLCGDDFMLLSGEDSNAFEFTLLGGHGTISVSSNVAPVRQHAIMKAALAGNADEARRLNKELELLHQRLFSMANPIPVKWALARMGKIELGIRSPLCQLDEVYHTGLEEAMTQAGALP